jgi:hypothetical protein
MEASIGALLQAWNKDPDLCLSRAGNAARGCRNLRREFAGNIECRQLPVGGATESIGMRSKQMRWICFERRGC